MRPASLGWNKPPTMGNCDTRPVTGPASPTGLRAKSAVLSIPIPMEPVNPRIRFSICTGDRPTKDVTGASILRTSGVLSVYWNFFSTRSNLASTISRPVKNDVFNAVSIKGFRPVGTGSPASAGLPGKERINCLARSLAILEPFSSLNAAL